MKLKNAAILTGVLSIVGFVAYKYLNRSLLDRKLKPCSQVPMPTGVNMVRINSLISKLWVDTQYNIFKVGFAERCNTFYEISKLSDDMLIALALTICKVKKITLYELCTDQLFNGCWWADPTTDIKVRLEKLNVT